MLTKPALQITEGHFTLKRRVNTPRSHRESINNGRMANPKRSRKQQNERN